MHIGKRGSRVLVAMSGGVDSSVVAVMLARNGYNVIGLTLQLARSSCGLGACCTGPDLEDVKALARAENFPHHTIAAYDDFKAQVIDYTVHSYATGLTPSPCVWCNSKVRFQYIYQAMKKFNCDLFATGHYAYSDGQSLHAGIDPNKDQTYFLSQLPLHILQYARFPLGNMHKTTVRKIAKAYNLKSATKKDSQDLCFVKDHYWDTLNQLKPSIFKPGPVKNTSNQIIGHHTGVAQYTIGQRKGIGHLTTSQSTSPLYIINTDAITNEITVGHKQDMAINTIYLDNINCFTNLTQGMFIQAKVRSRSQLHQARIWFNSNTNTNHINLTIEFALPIYEVARGQICVMYINRQVIASGMIINFTRYSQLNLTHNN